MSLRGQPRPTVAPRLAPTLAASNFASWLVSLLLHALRAFAQLPSLQLGLEIRSLSPHGLPCHGSAGSPASETSCTAAKFSIIGLPQAARSVSQFNQAVLPPPSHVGAFRRQHSVAGHLRGDRWSTERYFLLLRSMTTAAFWARAYASTRGRPPHGRASSSGVGRNTLRKRAGAEHNLPMGSHSNKFPPAANQSLNLSRNGKPAGPGPGSSAHFPVPGPAVSPLRPG